VGPEGECLRDPVQPRVPPRGRRRTDQQERAQVQPFWHIACQSELEYEVKETSIALFFRPVYAFEYLWRSKQKTQSLEIDGVTAESRTTSTSVGSRVSRRLSKELLFDIGADAVDLLVPGGGIALKVGRAVIRRSESKPPHA
jgi:hypothetical protein